MLQLIPSRVFARARAIPSTQLKFSPCCPLHPSRITRSSICATAYPSTAHILPNRSKSSSAPEPKVKGTNTVKETLRSPQRSAISPTIRYQGSATGVHAQPIHSPHQIQNIVASVYNPDAVFQVPVLPPDPPTTDEIPFPTTAIHPILRVRQPWYAHGAQIDWEFAQFGLRNAYEELFTHFEQMARKKLTEQERDLQLERQKEREAAAAEGKPAPYYEDEIPYEQLSKRGRKRYKERLTSTSPSLAVLKSVPRATYMDAFQAFANLGRLDGCEYIVRRLDQIGFQMDLDLAERWIGGIVIASISMRQQRTKEKAVKEQKALFSQAPPDLPKNSSDAEESSFPDNLLGESTTEQSAPNSNTSASMATNLPATNIPSYTLTSTPFTYSEGLTPTGLARVHINTVMSYLQRFDIMPNFRFIRSCFEAYAIDNDVHSGLSFVARLEKMKYNVSAMTYAAFIEALAKYQRTQPQLCMYVFLQMEKAKFPPSTISFNSLINAFALVGDYTTAYRLMQDMQKSRLYPDMETFSSIIEACCRAGKIELAEEMLQYLKTYATKLLSPKVLLEMSKEAQQQQQAAAQANQSKQLQTTTSTSQQGFQLGPQPYHVLIREYIRLRRLPDAVQLLNTMVESGPTPQLRTYHALLRACVDEKRAPVARQLWDQLIALGIPLNTQTYNLYLLSLDNWTEIKHLYHELTLGHQAHTATNVVSTSSSLHGPLTPDQRTFHALWFHVRRTGDLDAVPWILAEMRKYRILPTDVIMRGISRVLELHQKHEQARLLVVTFEKIGISALTDEFINKICRSDMSELQTEKNRLSKLFKDEADQAKREKLKLATGKEN